MCLCFIHNYWVYYARVFGSTIKLFFCCCCFPKQYKRILELNYTTRNLFMYVISACISTHTWIRTHMYTCIYIDTRANCFSMVLFSFWCFFPVNYSMIFICDLFYDFYLWPFLRILFVTFCMILICHLLCDCFPAI